MGAVSFTRQSDVKITHLQFEEAGQQLGVIDVGYGWSRSPRQGRYALRCVYAPPLRIAPRRDCLDNESLQEITRGIHFDRKPPFREVYLHHVRALLQAAANLTLVLAQEIIDKFLSPIARHSLVRILRLKAEGEMTACFTGTRA